MKESVVEAAVCTHAEENGWLVRKIGYPGRRGAPDRHFYKAGRLLIAEFKRPGKVATAQQDREHARLRAAGFEVHVIDNIEDGKALFA